MAVAAVGLPVNQLGAYALLLVATVVIFSGEVSARAGAWAAAVAIVAIAVAGQFLLAPPRIEEGHNVFLPSPALERELPAEVYRHLARNSTRSIRPPLRCQSGSVGCWQDGGLPDSAFAFSADGIFHKSRAVAFGDRNSISPIRSGCGSASSMRSVTIGTRRARRSSRRPRPPLLDGLHRWHLAMPWFEMIRLPAAYVGGELCWRGDLMWEGAGEHFTLLARRRLPHH